MACRGPVDGKTYTAQMVPMGQNDDEWIASIASYVRISFGNDASPLTPAAVKNLRAATKEHVEPWTLEEIQETILAKAPLDKGELKATAASHSRGGPLAIDDDPDTRYSTGPSRSQGSGSRSSCRGPCPSPA